ncbi:MAG: hypothetical protein HeimC3_27310 [Candidatus Heimdallarchaeota archaeon LC_3]|nr:MAG: hypothetical protein HeimC3_27310 [Candidatus Heimdallarchaeota archaeon LC_3]
MKCKIITSKSIKMNSKNIFTLKINQGEIRDFLLKYENKIHFLSR